MGFVEALLAFPLLLLIRVYVLDEMAFWLWLCTISPPVLCVRLSVSYTVAELYDCFS